MKHSKKSKRNNKIKPVAHNGYYVKSPSKLVLTITREGYTLDVHGRTHKLSPSELDDLFGLIMDVSELETAPIPVTPYPYH